MEASHIAMKDWNAHDLLHGREIPGCAPYELPVNEEVSPDDKSISHDIRESLLSMVATLKLLSRGYYGKIGRGVAGQLNELLSRTVGLIRGMEEYEGKTSLAGGDAMMGAKVLDLAQDIVNPVLEVLSTEIREHPTRVVNRLTRLSGGTIHVKGSELWLRSVFWNLLKNAIQYGDKGGTVVLDAQQDGACCRVNVFNTGTPVPEADRDKLFARFLKSEGGSNGSTRGVGLGLYLVKKIIQQHGGAIWYEAREYGSNVVFTLPAGDPAFTVQTAHQISEANSEATLPVRPRQTPEWEQLPAPRSIRRR
jgi:signal transduction histidine kinase